MIKWRGDGLGMVIEQARDERADDEVVRVEDLVDGRRLVDASREECRCDGVIGALMLSDRCV